MVKFHAALRNQDLFIIIVSTSISLTQSVLRKSNILRLIFTFANVALYVCLFAIEGMTNGLYFAQMKVEQVGGNLKEKV